VKLRSSLPLIAVALSLLAVWPAASSPFHDPKRWVFLLAAGLGALAALPRWRWTALPLVALTVVQPWRSAEAGWQALAFAWALAAWPALRPEVRAFTRVAGIAGAVVGLVVLLQFFGIDLFAHAGPDAGTGRLRLYGTLGNPDFVASALLPILLLSLSPAGERVGERGVQVLLLLPILAALLLTRSFATLLSGGVALLVLLLHRRGARVVPLLLICAVLALGLVGRDLRGTLAGRSYLVSVALPHVADAPLLGQGIGSTVQEWPAWELSYWQARCADAACVAAHPQGRFAALQDHVHADWLEWLLERGVLGVLALLLALGAPLLAAWRQRDVQGSFVLAAVAAMLPRSLVDFPLQRPADLCLLAALLALPRASSGLIKTGAPPRSL
jgi:putative inorganic carbon (hco3(-)) transporter